jgi:putative molybdopterin biosynthesis protein
MTSQPHADVQQSQFLDVVSREEAVARFEAALFPYASRRRMAPVLEALGLPLAQDVAAPVDAPPFDRSNVDGFAVRAGDLAQASEARPVVLRLNGEVVRCGASPRLPLAPGTATPIATGAPLPRGADAIVMVERTHPHGEDAIEVTRAAAPGQFVSFAGSDIARGETLLRAGAVLGSREIGMLAACGVAQVEVIARPRVGVLSTGDELIAGGKPLRPGAIYDANGPVIAAAVAENGGEAHLLGAVADDEAALQTAVAAAFDSYDMLILSGGTSKGAGDLTCAIVARLGAPGIVAHGVALKPGKPLCLAVCAGKPVVVLPGFPTSAMFTFHDIVAPALRRMAGLPPRAQARVEARLPVRVASELGRREYVMASLVDGPDGLSAYPSAKGSGAVTSFAQADGFFVIDALADHAPAQSQVETFLFSANARPPDLVAVGSHCVGLDIAVAPLARAGFSVRSIALGSLGGLAAARRGDCDLAPMHLFDEAAGAWNAPFLTEELELVEGWRRMQGVVHRADDARFAGCDAQGAVAAALADPLCFMANRNQGAGTRMLIDRLLGGARPEGYFNQPRSHNAVAAAVAQGRADWGVAIAPVAQAYGLAFIPLAQEHYDFALVRARRERPAVQAFLASLRSRPTQDALRAAGFEPAQPAQD